MTIDEPLYHVARKWYWLYWWLMVGLSATVLAGYVVVHVAANFAPYETTFNLNDTALILSCLSLGFLLTLFWVIRRFSLTLASMIGTMITALVILNGINAAEPSIGALPYASIWMGMAVLNGMYGVPIVLGTALLMINYVLLRADFQISNMSDVMWLLLAGSFVMAAAGYYLWRNQFVDVQEQQMSKLSGMLKSNQLQSEILIESIADGVIVINTEGKISLMNPAAAAMTEWTTAEAIGLEAQLVVKFTKENGEELESDQDPLTLVLEKKQHINHILELTGREGKKQIVSLVVSPVLMPGTQTLAGIVAVMRDISEERVAEQQRAEFISTASHEMRTPVAAIEGYLALALNDKVSSVDIRAREFLEKAHASTQHLGKLFQDLLTSSKAEDGRLSNHPVVTETGALLQQLFGELKFSAEKKGLFVEFVIGSSENTIDATTGDVAQGHVLKPLYYAWVDPERIREVVTNLFDNACKYTEQGKISIGLTGNAEVVQIYVRDTGSGIPPEDVPHLFQKFYRVDSSATRVIGGTGLGLFICRKIVELYQGRIWVESELGKGSTFFINIPRLSSTRAAELQASEESQAPTSPKAATTKSMVQ